MTEHKSKSFGNTKHAFWEALVLTTLIFIFGIFIGIAYEGNKLDEITGYYDASEISLMDSFALNNLVASSDDCNILINSHIDFANRIYDEAFLLEKYEDSEKITENLRTAHRKYDLMRTLLWINTMKTSEKCENNFSVVVYLYEYETDDLVKKAELNVWSKILFDLKQDKKDEIILIPIAVDSDLVSLNSILDSFNIKEYPAIIIDDKHVVYELISVEDLEVYF